MKQIQIWGPSTGPQLDTVQAHSPAVQASAARTDSAVRALSEGLRSPKCVFFSSTVDAEVIVYCLYFEKCFFPPHWQGSVALFKMQGSVLPVTWNGIVENNSVCVLLLQMMPVN